MNHHEWNTPIHMANAILSSAASFHAVAFVWEELVHVYSTADVSFPTKGKLIATSGLAKKLGPPGEHLAGRWKPYLPDQPLWTVSTDEELPRPRRSTKCRALSWLWASFDGPTFLSTPVEINQQDYSIEFIDAPIIHFPDDVTGQIKSAVLRARGVLAGLSLSVRFEEVDERLILEESKGPLFVKGTQQRGLDATS